MIAGLPTLQVVVVSTRQGRKGRKSGSFPVLILIHGGPELQARGGFDPFVQYLVSKGIAVLQPNVRGSSGYGVTWRPPVYGSCAVL